METIDLLDRRPPYKPAAQPEAAPGWLPPGRLVNARALPVLPLPRPRHPSEENPPDVNVRRVLTTIVWARSGPTPVGAGVGPG